MMAQPHNYKKNVNNSLNSASVVRIVRSDNKPKPEYSCNSIEFYLNRWMLAQSSNLIVFVKSMNDVNSAVHNVYSKFFGLSYNIYVTKK